MEVLAQNTTTTVETVTTITPTSKSTYETEIPTRIQSNKPISYTNGFLKRHHHHPPPLHNNRPVIVSYKECLKNHAASIGGHAVDGCGEFMPSPTSDLKDPKSLKCAACGCHRNFHRREPDDQPSPLTVTSSAAEFQPHHRHQPPPPRSPNSSSPPPISSSHMLLSLSGNNNTTSPVANVSPINNLNFDLVPGGGVMGQIMDLGSRKRFRTKFSQYQKEKMFEFAERVGWKMQKRDDELIRDFCRCVDVDKGVLKVWMHNNKNTFGKRDFSGGDGDDHRGFAGDGDAHVATNGSSSSS